MLCASARRRRRWLGAVFVVVGCATFTALCRACWPFTPDDAYITLRYAQHLASGQGPTFNAGGPPVEGYTSFLWMLLLALPHWLGWDAVFVAKAASVTAMVACGAVAAVFAASLTRSPTRSVFTPTAVTMLLLGSVPATAVHAVSGMETALFAFLLMLFLTILTGLGREPKLRQTVGLAIVALLLGLARPEGNLAVVVGVLGTLPALFVSARWRLLCSLAAIYVFGGATYMLWRITYYGLLFPLPFYLKVFSPSLFAGSRNVWLFCVHFGVPLGVLVALGLIRAPRTLLPACGAAMALLGFYIFPAHIMGYHWRYLFPLLPFLCALAAIGYANLQSWMESFAWPRTLSAGVLLVIPLALTLRLVGGAPDAISDVVDYASGLTRAHTALGQALHDLHVSGRSPVLAIGDSGAVPYYSGWHTIDTFGLNDVHIACSGIRDPEYVFSQHPDLIVLISARPHRFEPLLAWENALYQRALSVGMIRLRALEFEPGAYYLWLLALPDNDIAAALRAP